MLDYCHDCARAYLQTVVERLNYQNNVDYVFLKRLPNRQSFELSNRHGRLIEVDMLNDVIYTHDRRTQTIPYLDLEVVLRRIMI
jgi:hypothetical protein